MGFLDKNLRILRDRDETLAREIEKHRVTMPIELVSAKNNQLTLRAKGLSMHSAYDPTKEAGLQVKRFLGEATEEGPILVLGLGLGYHVERLLQTVSTPVFLIEPNLEIFRTALESRDLENVLTGCRGIFTGVPVEAVLENLKAGRVSLDACRVFVHQPSMRLAPIYFEGFLTKLKAKNALQGLKLNILVVPPIYGGSLPVAQNCQRAFRELGHRVTMIDNSIYYPALEGIEKTTGNKHHQDQLRGSLAQHIAERVMAKCLALKPDLVFALAQAPLTPGILDRMREFDFVTAFWFVEDFREFDYWRAVAERYHHFFAIQKREVFSEFDTLAGVDFAYLPLACDPSVHKSLKLKDREQKRFGSEVSFVGAGYHNRQIFFHSLLDLDFKIWGTEWNLALPLGSVVQEGGRRVTSRESVKIFNGSKININLHSSTYHRGINPAGDFVNPRTFEIASCGGFQLVDPRSHLPELFRPGEELICFDSREDLREKIAYYLSHPEERESVALEGKERARRDHTYRKRMGEVLERVVGKHAARFETKKERAQTPARLIEEAGAKTDLGRFLSRFQGDEPLTLDRIVSEIHRGEGNLTDPEVIFLLMHELWKTKGGHN